MNDQATKSKNRDNGSSDSSAIQAKLARKEGIKANQHRVNWRANSEETSVSSNDRQSTLSTAYKEHKDILVFLEPFLASLPSSTFQLPAKDFASLALSAAVLYKNANEKLIRTSNMSSFPSSTRFKFELKASQKLKKKEEFKSLSEDTATKVLQFQTFLRGAIIETQKLEVAESKVNLQKTIIHNALLLNNHLVRFYKTLYADTRFPDSAPNSDENILSQDAVRTTFSGKLFEFDIANQTTANISITKVRDDDTEENVQKSKETYSNFLEYMCVTKSNELVILFNKFIYNSKKKSATKITSPKETFPKRNEVYSPPTTWGSPARSAYSGRTIVTNATTISSITEASSIQTPRAFHHRFNFVSPMTVPTGLAEKVNESQSPSSISIDIDTQPTNKASILTLASDSLKTNSTLESTTATQTDSTMTTVPRPDTQSHIFPPPHSRTTKPSPPLLRKRYSDRDEKILNSVLPILHQLVPLLTISVFDKFEEAARFKLAEAECAAMYENTKRSQLSNDVEKLLASEESVTAPLLKTIVNEDVKAELRAMKNKFNTQQQKLKEAQNKLEQAKLELLSLPLKDGAVDKSLSTTAQSRKYKKKRPLRNQKEGTVLKVNTPSPLSTSQNTSQNTPSQKETKRKRNLRQKENRKRRKATPNQGNQGGSNSETL